MGNTLFAIGEALIDFIPNESGVEFSQVSGFSPRVGGAPANVCGAFSRLGGHSCLLTQLGEDPFGQKICQELTNFGVDTRYIVRTEQANTALAFVSLDKDGDRTFAFYRKPSADMLYQPEQVRPEWFADAYALHFCSVALATKSMQQAHSKAIECALENNALISFDPNLRFPLWKDREELRRVIWKYLPYAHILKISEEELEFIAGTKEIQKALKLLFVGNVRLVLYTSGGGTSAAFVPSAQAFCKAEKLEAVDTTGAGDGFIGSFLYSLFERRITPKMLETLKESELNDMLAFSNRFCAKSVMKKGAIASYPTQHELEIG